MSGLEGNCFTSSAAVANFSARSDIGTSFSVFLHRDWAGGLSPVARGFERGRFLLEFAKSLFFMGLGGIPPPIDKPSPSVGFIRPGPPAFFPMRANHGGRSRNRVVRHAWQFVAANRQGLASETCSMIDCKKSSALRIVFLEQVHKFQKIAFHFQGVGRNDFPRELSRVRRFCVSSIFIEQ